MTFAAAFARTIGHEGGYVNDPRDPGGETKFGISKRAYPGEDIAGLTIERAAALYARDYWTPIKGDQLPDAVAAEVFDAAVNHGVSAGVRMLQRAVGVSADGIMGPVTLATAQAIEPMHFVLRFNAARLEFYADLPTFPAFGRGWARRVAGNLRSAANA